MKLRLAAPTDLETLLPLVAAYHRFEGIRHTPESTRAALRPLLEDPALGRVWLIEEDGAVAGYIALCFGYSIEFGGRDAFVDELYLLESCRGRGLGKAALDAAAREATALGVVALHLEVGTENAKARKLYEAAGFVPRSGFALLSRRLS